ncbi:hypothetical protein D3C76_1002530 [compost metagenome]
MKTPEKSAEAVVAEMGSNVLGAKGGRSDNTHDELLCTELELFETEPGKKNASASTGWPNMKARVDPDEDMKGKSE